MNLKNCCLVFALMVSVLSITAYGDGATAVEGFDRTANWVKGDHEGKGWPRNAKLAFVKEDSPSGGRSVVITCPGLAKGGRLDLRMKDMLAIPGQPSALGLWIKANAPYNFGLAVVDGRGESFAQWGSTSKPNEWEFVIFKLGSGIHWSGNNDGIIDYPVRMMSLAVQPDEQNPRAFVQVAFDGLTAISGDPAAVKVENRVQKQAQPRTAPKYVCPRVKAPVTIDGVLSEWTSVEPLVLDSKDQVFTSEWNGPADLSGRIYMQWDHDNLYLAADVKDNRLFWSQDAYTQWMCDSLQFTFATDGAKGGWTEHDYSYSFSLVREVQKFMDLTVSGSETLRPVLYRLDHASQRPPGIVDAARSAVKTSDKGYTLEIAIPWSELNPLIPIRTTGCGFGIIINDNEGKGRKGWIAWTPGIGEDTGTGQFGELSFTGESELEVFISTPKVLYRDDENVTARLWVKSAQPRGQFPVEWRVLTSAGEKVAGEDRRIDLQTGLNEISAVWSTGLHPRGTYTLQASLADSKSAAKLQFQKESLSDLRRRTGELKVKAEKMMATIAEADKRGINTQYPLVSVRTIEEVCRTWEFMAADNGRKRPDVAERMVSYAEKLAMRTQEELLRLLAHPEIAKPKVPTLDLLKGFTIRDGVIYNGDNPAILIGIMAGGSFEHSLDVIDKAPDLGFNMFNIIEPVGPSRILTDDGTIRTEHLEWIKKQFERANAKKLAVDLHLQDHYYEGVLSKEFPDVYDPNRCNTGNHAVYGTRCLDRPNDREILRRWLGVLIPTVRNQASLFCYDLGNETRFSCSCPFRMDLFRNWLMEKYGNLAAINAAWGTTLTSLDAIPPVYQRMFETQEYGTAVFTSFYQNCPAARFDFTRFNQIRFMDWMDYFKRTIRTMDPKTFTFIKLMMYGWPYKEHQLVGSGYDREGLAGIMDINGMDGLPLYIYYPDTLGKRVDKAYLGAMFCDMLKCLMPGKPVMNAENLCADYNFGYVPPEAYKMAIWDEVLHGQAVTDVWLWSQTTPWTPGSQYDSRPEMMDALGRSSLDIRRLAPQVVKFQQMERDVNILYSQTSLSWSDATEDSMREWYIAMTGLNASLGFVSENQIRQGKPDHTRVLIIPRVDYLPDDVVAKIGEFGRKGGTVMVSSPSLGFNEHGKPRKIAVPGAKVYGTEFNPSKIEHAEMFDRILTKAKVRRPVKVLSSNGRLNPNLESRTVTLDQGKFLTFVLNRSKEVVKVKIQADGKIKKVRDLVSMQVMKPEFSMPPVDVLILEVETE